MIPKKRLLLKYHKPSSTPHVTPSPTTTVNPTPTSNTTTIVTPSPTPTCNPSPIVTPPHSLNATPSPSKRKFTKNSTNRRKKNVNDIEPVPLPANVNVQDPEPLPAKDHDLILGELDVIDNDNFESGTNSKDDGIVNIRRKKLRQIKKANEKRVRLHSIETIRKLFLAKNDKVRIRAKCLGRIPVFTLDGEGPSNTKEVAPTKKTTKVKGKKDVGPSDPVGPNKKGVSLGGRGRPKTLAADECPWDLQITKVKNTKTWEVRTYTDEHKCLQ
nr:hypothetical protein [Tanacetum cinerariifolium]